MIASTFKVMMRRRRTKSEPVFTNHANGINNVPPVFRPQPN
jgi:hypothetical protein